MKVIVTGGAGFIGSHLVRLLVRLGWHVLNFDKLTYAGNLASLRDISSEGNYTFVQGDICDGTAFRAALNNFRPEAIFHLAAESHVDRSIDGPGAFIDTNVNGTYTILEAAREYHKENAGSGFRFIHVSTDEVYGSLAMDDPPFRETNSYAPHSPYSASKAASDHLARAWHDTYGLPVMVTNCSNNYGPCQFPEKLIPVVILNALKGKAIPVYGNGKNIRDWLYVTDHAKALLKVLEGGRPGQTYNIGGNNEMQNLDLVRLICRHLDELHPRRDGVSYADQITFVTDRPGHDLRYAIDGSKIHEELGWRPEESRESGLRKTVSWYLENESWWQEVLSGDYLLERKGLG